MYKLYFSQTHTHNKLKKKGYMNNNTRCFFEGGLIFHILSERCSLFIVSNITCFIKYIEDNIYSYYRSFLNNKTILYFVMFMFMLVYKK